MSTHDEKMAKLRREHNETMARSAEAMRTMKAIRDNNIDLFRRCDIMQEKLKLMEQDLNWIQKRLEKESTMREILDILHSLTNVENENVASNLSQVVIDMKEVDDANDKVDAAAESTSL